MSKIKKKKSADEGVKNRKPHPIDLHVGRRIRMRRSMMGISQEKLAEALGLTFQQIQKYEHGLNRVSASRLYHIAALLDVPTSYFYEELAESAAKPSAKIPQLGLSDQKQEELVEDDLLYTPESLDLLKVYYSVKSESKRKELFKIFRSMVDSVSSE